MRRGCARRTELLSWAKGMTENRKLSGHLTRCPRCLERLLAVERILTPELVATAISAGDDETSDEESARFSTRFLRELSVQREVDAILSHPNEHWAGEAVKHVRVTDVRFIEGFARRLRDVATAAPLAVIETGHVLIRAAALAAEDEDADTVYEARTLLWHAMGLALAAMDDHVEAIAAYDAAEVALSEPLIAMEWAEILLGRGRSLVRLGRLKAARRNLRLSEVAFRRSYREGKEARAELRRLKPRIAPRPRPLRAGRT